MSDAATARHGHHVQVYVFSNGEPLTLCLACKAQAGIVGEGAEVGGDVACDWCGKGRLQRRWHPATSVETTDAERVEALQGQVRDLWHAVRTCRNALGCIKQVPADALIKEVAHEALERTQRFA